MWELNNGKYVNNTCNKCCCDCEKMKSVINHCDAFKLDCDCCEKEEYFGCNECEYENE